MIYTIARDTDGTIVSGYYDTLSEAGHDCAILMRIAPVAHGWIVRAMNVDDYYEEVWK